MDMEKIKKIHNKVGRYVNQNFSKGFTGALNAFGNIVPTEAKPNIASRKANHYNEVSKFINHSWHTVGEHIHSSIVDLNVTRGDNKMTEQENNGCKTNAEKGPRNSSYYASNHNSKLKLKNEW